VAHLSASLYAADLLTPTVTGNRLDEGEWQLHLGGGTWCYVSATDADRIAATFTALAVDLLAREIAEENRQEATKVAAAEATIDRALGEAVIVDAEGVERSVIGDAVQDTDPTPVHGTERPGAPVEDLPGVWIVDAAVA